MERKYYYVYGKKYTIEELSKTYDISIPTLYRRLKSGLTAEQSIEFQRKRRELSQVYLKQNQIEYPENLILDLLADKKDFKFDLNKIKENFDENYNALILENQDFFEIRNVKMIEDLYQNHLSLKQVSDKYNISVQWVIKIKKTFILTLQNPYFSDYYIMGKEFANKKEDYYKFREHQLVEELKLIPEEGNSQTLLPDKTLMVDISIKRLNLPESLESKFMSKKITTINQILELEKKDLKLYVKLTHKESIQLKEAIKEFIARGYYYV